MMSTHDHGPAAHSPADHAAPASPEEVKDPVCGMLVVPGQARGGSFDHEGMTHWFCSPRCNEKFHADPAADLTPAGAPVVAASPLPVVAAGPAPGVEYTCPMHPEMAPAPTSRWRARA